MRLCAAAIVRTSGSLTPCSFAACAERKSIAGSRRAQHGDDCVMEAGVRQEADHALPRRQLTSRALELLF